MCTRVKIDAALLKHHTRVRSIGSIMEAARSCEASGQELGVEPNGFVDGLGGLINTPPTLVRTVSGAR